MKYILTLLIAIISFSGFSQAKDHRIYKDTRIINLQSVETLKKSKLDFRVGHKFGDLAGANGGWPTFYGLEGASDVLIAFDYGVTDNLMIGVGRVKGAGVHKQIVYGHFKYKLISQNSELSKPLSMAVHGMMRMTTMQSTGGVGTLTSFEKFSYRLAYHVGFLVAKKFGNRLSMQFNAGWTYRNIVRTSDTNDLASIGGSIKYQLTKTFAIIGEITAPFSEYRANAQEANFSPASGIGFEWETGGGHIFQMNFTNAEGILVTDFIPNTRTQWSEGEFRLGFTISRLFTI